MTGVAAIVLAAGRGTRFGNRPKLLALLDGKPLVRHAVEAATASGLRPVLVVTGHRDDGVRSAIGDLHPLFIANPDFAGGLATSLRAGFAALPPDTEAACVLLGDMPRIGPALLDALIEAWRRSGRPDALVPTFGGRRGNPVLLSRRLVPEIARLAGDVGAGPLLRGRPKVVEFPVASEAILLDVDTGEALTELSGQAPASTTPSSTAE